MGRCETIWVIVWESIVKRDFTEEFVGISLAGPSGFVFFHGKPICDFRPSGDENLEFGGCYN